MERLGGFPALEGDAVDFPATGDVCAEPIREGVHAFRPDAVESAGVFIGTLAEFSACVEVSQYELDGGDAELGVHVHGDAPAIV